MGKLNMKNKLTHKEKIRRLTLLINFMQCNNILKSFLINFNKLDNIAWRKRVLPHKSYIDIRIYLNDIAINLMKYKNNIFDEQVFTVDFRGFFLFAFDWYNTNETEAFWSEISYKWRKYLIENNQ